MNLNVNVRLTDTTVNTDAFRKHVQDVLDIAITKAFEAAVERAPAAGQTPYSTGQIAKS